MVFRPIIGAVGVAGTPVITKLLLGFAASEPMEPHVHCFCSACLDIACDNTVSGAVVRLDGCGRLLVSHFFEEVAHWDGFACVYVESAKFGFSGTRHDSFEDLGDVEDGAVVGGVLNIRGAEKVSTHAAAGEGFAEVRCIAVDGENHLALPVGEDCIGVGGGVIEESPDEVNGVLGGSGLCGGE